jgi:Tetracyclin repressor-like, C-terminal domain
MRQAQGAAGVSNVVVGAASGGEWDFDAAFESGLDIIIDGLAAHSKKVAHPV